MQYTLFADAYFSINMFNQPFMTRNPFISICLFFAVMFLFTACKQKDTVQTTTAKETILTDSIPPKTEINPTPLDTLTNDTINKNKMKTEITLMRRVGNDLIKKNKSFIAALVIIGAIFPMIIELVSNERITTDGYLELSLTYFNILFPTILAIVVIGMIFSVARHYSKKSK